MASDALRRQLMIARFDRAMEVAESLADVRALLTTTELARLNLILTGQEGKKDGVGKEGDTEGPWRDGPVTIQLPSGKLETLQVLADPKVTARDRLHRATEIAEAGSPIEAAVDIYSGLVLSHVFADANRRTAALAAHYFLKRYDVPVSGLALHEIGLGDLREEGEIQSLRETVVQMAKFAEKREKRKN